MPGTQSGFLMTDDDFDGIYSLTILNVLPEIYSYKYFIVSNDISTWDLGEWTGNPNRNLTVDLQNITVGNVWADINIHIITIDDIPQFFGINEIMALDFS